MMNVEDIGWSGPISSVVSNSESREPSQREHSFLAEDAAWIDTCLTLNPKMSDDDWGPLKEALLNIINTSVSLGHQQAVALASRAISEACDDIFMKSEEADAMLLRGDTGDPILVNPFDQEEIGAALSVEGIKSPSVRDDSSGTALNAEDVDDLITGISDLTLRPSICSNFRQIRRGFLPQLVVEDEMSMIDSISSRVASTRDSREFFPLNLNHSSRINSN